MIHHVSVEVSDIRRAGSFYDRLLAPLGWRRHLNAHNLIGWGLVDPIFFITPRRGPGAGGGHVCFAAKGIPAVKAVWEAGVAAGGASEDEPGQRPGYGPAYYSAYLRDPDGNRLEVAVSRD